MKYTWLRVSFVVFFLLIAGCQQSATLYLGAQANEDAVVTMVQSEKKHRQWEDLYVSIDYSYKRDKNHFGIKGVLSFTDNCKVNYLRLRDLKLKLFLLDKQLQVVEYYDIARALGTDLDQQQEFLKVLKVPDEVVAFTFGYEGMLVTDESFYFAIWNLPKLSH